MLNRLLAKASGIERLLAIYLELGVSFLLESEGCLVVLAVFKTVVGSAYPEPG